MQRREGRIAHLHAHGQDLIPRREHKKTVHESPDREGNKGLPRMRLGPADKAEHEGREQVAGIEEDEMGGELVHDVAGRFDLHHLQGRGNGHDNPVRNADLTTQPGHETEHAEHVDEPQNAVGLDHRHGHVMGHGGR